MTACPVDAITISSAEAKVVLDDVCVGCKLCTIACPYGTMFYNPETEKASKCNFCDGQPACLGEHVEVLVNDAVLDVVHTLDSPLHNGDRIALIGQYLGG